MDRQLLDREQQYAKCNICMNLYDRKTRRYAVCPDGHVTCRACLFDQDNRDNCPVCSLSLKPSTTPIDHGIVDIMAWHEVLNLGNAPIRQEQPQGIQMGKFNVEEPGNNEGSGGSAGVSYSFGQFYNGTEIDQQPFFGVRIDISGYLALLGVQFLFTLLNFYFGLKRVDETGCSASNQHQSLGYQSWLLGIGLLEIVFMSFTLLFILFFRGNCISHDQFYSCWKIIKVIFSIKIIAWSALQIIIFIRGIPSSCVPGLHIFGMLNAILHVFLLSVVCAELGNLRKKLFFILVQFFIAFFNIYYGFDSLEQLSPKEEFRDTVWAYQGWMRTVGLFQWGFMILVIILYRCQSWGLNVSKLGRVIIVLYGLKIVLWVGMQSFTFVYRLQALRSCSGGLLLYLIVNAALHVTFLVVVFRKSKKYG